MRIVVAAGGTSTERDVSLVSGMGIYRALRSKGYECILLDVFFGYPGDDWETVFDKDKDWAESIEYIKANNPDIEAVKALRPDWKDSFFGPHVIDICREADLVFIALHGENGENGKVQACFDLNGINYTGADYKSSALCMDKGLTKDLFRSSGIPCPKGVRVHKGEGIPSDFPLPCIVKACCGGSSVGVSIARSIEEYKPALDNAFKYDDEVIIEEFIAGREFSVGVIDGKALPVIEIAPKEGFYDYKNKYQPGATVETCPAELSLELTEKVQKIAEEAFKVLRLRDYVRFDFIMDPEGNFYCLEANTLPGMTPVSLLPQEAKAMGIDFEELCQLLITIAMRRMDGYIF
ncbi:MAG: D-alanine--D-alanine ligase [Lachnospiraceae bacterium]|nr:D-alanine--D-alanine ligase [Lachnospiraceae bacterium]